ncbi:unnamed protein product [Clonostachys chloroleuca]|uniref:Calcium-transporting ATPase n=1 Tax=Clonostachys chloroleuca TaxID=1926264 RepID=A0AA35M0Z8_9HYPO|nr:unnamed protein product [Clonostachys chloroleuca]
MAFNSNRQMLSPPSQWIDTRSRSSSKAETLASTALAASSVAPSTQGSILEEPKAALQAYPGTEADFFVQDNPFAFTPGHLNKLLNPKSLSVFRALGGLRGIIRGLQTDATSGLSVDETSPRTRISYDEAVYGLARDLKVELPPSSEAFGERIRVFKRNILPPKKPTSLLRLMWNAYNDKVLILLTVAAAVSLALGLYETLGVKQPPSEPMPVNWIEGVAICAAIAIVTLVGSLNDYQKECAFVKLNAKKDERQVAVIRSGRKQVIDVQDLLVGDVVSLEPGDIIPVDGIFIQGSDVRCDESSATGESEALPKTAGDTVMAAITEGCNTNGLDPFIISGAKVLQGTGTFVATSVGVNSSFGKIMVSVRVDIETTPLQKKLEGLAMAIAKLGSGAACLLFAVLLIRFLASLSSDDRTAAEKASSFLNILIVAVTIIVVAVPEGLPLAVTLALAVATKRLVKEKNLVRVLRACETMGNATAICSDKTGTLTANKMTVVAGTFGSTCFSKPSSAESTASHTSVSQWASQLSEPARRLITCSVACNSTAFESKEDGDASAFVGSKTETALLSLARDHLGMPHVEEVRNISPIVTKWDFDSRRKCMATVVALNKDEGGGYRLLVKGASEILLKHCKYKVDMESLGQSELSRDERRALEATINGYASQSLRTIGLVYANYKQWPPVHASREALTTILPSSGTETDLTVPLEPLLADLTFLGVAGIRDPVRPGVPEAVAKARSAGVQTRMVTGDNVVTARAIATECGIYTEGGIVMEGPEFRKLTDEELRQILPKLQVLARSSPEDKRVLVTKLKELFDETVAVTGDGTNDAPALKAADVGFSMGLSGTEVAKEASAIILMDDNFTSIITALKWGRAVNDAVQKFLQFQITVNITAVLIAFITSVSNNKMESVLKAVQLLWINLIMDTFAALALATDPPTDRILDRQPQGKKSPLITINMWKMITAQTFFQLVVSLVLYFAGPEILGYDRADEDQMLELNTIIFNTFVWMQIFNEFNNRRLDNRLNIFEGIHRNHFFVGITILMVGLQVAIIYIGSRAFSIKEGGIDGTQWAISVVTAFLCVPYAVLVRLFPDEWFSKIAITVGAPFAVMYRALGRGWRVMTGCWRKPGRRDDSEAASLPSHAARDEESSPTYTERKSPMEVGVSKEATVHKVQTNLPIVVHVDSS